MSPATDLSSSASSPSASRTRAHRDEVEQREGALFAGFELGKRADTVGRGQDGVQLFEKRIALLEQLAALLDVVDDGESRRPVFRLARPLQRHAAEARSASAPPSSASLESLS